MQKIQKIHEESFYSEQRIVSNSIWWYFQMTKERIVIESAKIRLPLPSSGLSARRSAWASVSTSGPIEDDRSRRHKVAASHLGFEPLDGAASRVLAEEGGRRKSRVGREGEDKWPGRGSPLKRSSGVSSVEARVWPKAHSTSPCSSRARLELKIDSWKKG